MRSRFLFRASRAPVLGLLALASACADEPIAPGLRPQPDHFTGEYECIVDVGAGTTNCHPVSLAGEGAGPRLDVLPGAGPLTFAGSWVHSRGNAADEDTSTATMYFTNNMGQPIGTTDGTTAHANGNRLFFSTVPHVSAVYSGTIAESSIYLAFPDGTDTFTNPEGTMTFASRPYYTYSGIVAPGATSTSRMIRYIYSSNVKSFRYGYRVSTPVQYEYGWITVAPSSVPVLAPGGAVSLAGTVYDAFGVAQADGITWSSSDPAVATVNASTGAVTAVGEGTATITAISTVNAQRSGTRAVIVDAAPSVSGTTPAHNATEVPAASSIVVAFSEAVSVSASSFTLECDSNAQPFTVSGSGTGTVTLDPDSNLPPQGVCHVTVVAAQVDDADTNDGPNQPVADYVFGFQVASEFGGDP